MTEDLLLVQVATEELVPDPAGSQFDVLWEEEWQTHLQQAALEKLKRRVSARHYQIFYCHVIEGMPVKKVAQMLGTNVAKIYMVKHRLGPAFRKAVREIERAQT